MTLRNTVGPLILPILHRLSPKRYYSIEPDAEETPTLAHCMGTVLMVLVACALIEYIVGFWLTIVGEQQEPYKQLSCILLQLFKLTTLWLTAAVMVVFCATSRCALPSLIRAWRSLCLIPIVYLLLILYDRFLGGEGQYWWDTPFCMESISEPVRWFYRGDRLFRATRLHGLMPTLRWYLKGKGAIVLYPMFILPAILLWCFMRYGIRASRLRSGVASVLTALAAQAMGLAWICFVQYMMVPRIPFIQDPRLRVDPPF